MDLQTSKAFVRILGVLSLLALGAKLAGFDEPPESPVLSAAGLILWASSEYDWYRRRSSK
ncbi:hypothetical protein KBK24_0121815 [Burkholderia sp. K24]|nr:hypothetical protein KBK24_0121815 [Burkholderia sp. K24]